MPKWHRPASAGAIPGEIYAYHMHIHMSIYLSIYLYIYTYRSRVKGLTHHRSNGLNLDKYCLGARRSKIYANRIATADAGHCCNGCYRRPVGHGCEVTCSLSRSKEFALTWYRALTWYFLRLSPPRTHFKPWKAVGTRGRGSLAAR